MFLAGFDNHRHHIETRSAHISYLDLGAGPTALFVHGVATNAYLWADVVRQVADVRRAVVIDLPGHGQSSAGPDQAMTIGAFADLLFEFCEGLHLHEVDLVAHDTGGAIAQVFAGRHPELIASLTLTNCDTHDNVPPEAFAPTVELARAGQIVPAAPVLLADLAAARSTLFAPGYEDPEFLAIDVVEAFLQPILGTPAAAEKLQELIAGLEPSDLLAAEPALRELDVPALIVWATADEFFDVKWAYWLHDLLPGAQDVVEIDGAKLFFPHERASELASHLRHFWNRDHRPA